MSGAIIELQRLRATSMRRQQGALGGPRVVTLGLWEEDEMQRVERSHPRSPHQFTLGRQSGVQAAWPSYCVLSRSLDADAQPGVLLLGALAVSGLPRPWSVDGW